MLRGEVWWASQGEPVASEPGYRRPVLVVQADALNRSQIATVVVAAITTNLRLALAPGNVTLTWLLRPSASAVLRVEHALLGRRRAP